MKLLLSSVCLTQNISCQDTSKISVIPFIFMANQIGQGSTLLKSEILASPDIILERSHSIRILEGTLLFLPIWKFGLLTNYEGHREACVKYFQ